MNDKDIIFLTPIKDYGIFDEYCQMAAADHFWVYWRFEVLKKVAPELLKGKILDVGCGNGVVRGMLEGLFDCVVSGCDLVIDILRLIPPGKGRIYFYDVNQREKQLKGEFPLILLMDVLEHINDPVTFLGSAGYHLTEGGRLIVNVPAWPYLYSSYDKVQGHVKRYTMDVLKKELDAAGYDIQKITYWGMVLWPIVCLRKFLLRFFPEKDAVRVSYPSSPFVDFIMGIMMRMELLLGSRWPFGTSIMAVAVKRENI